MGPPSHAMVLIAGRGESCALDEHHSPRWGFFRLIRWSLKAKFPQAGPESIRMQPKNDRGAFGAGNPPVAGFKDLLEIVPFNLFQGPSPRHGREGGCRRAPRGF